MSCERADITMVMFRNFFGSALVPLLAENFRRSAFVWDWNYEADFFKEVVEKGAAGCRHRRVRRARALLPGNGPPAPSLMPMALGRCP